MSDDAASAVEAGSAGPTDANWQDPPKQAGPTNVPILSAEGFEGPLDWLLDMARAQKIDLAKLPIAALIRSFVDALDAALSRPDGRPLDLSRWGDWLVMAATLTQLRSRLLLPAEAPEAKTALSEAEALRRQLVGRQEMRAAADWLERQPQLGRDVLARGRPEGHAASRGADITDLLRACLKLLQVPPDLAAVYRPRPPPFWRVSQAVARIETMLLKDPAGAALAVFLPGIAVEVPDREVRCRAAVAGTLVAGLELAKAGNVLLGQAEDWGEISLRRSAGEEACDVAPARACQLK